MPGASFALSHSGNYLSAVLHHLLRMETAFAASQALNEDARLFVYQDTHRAPPASLTIFSAPSFIPCAIVNPSPDSRRISWPFSTLVPSMRITTGNLMFKSFAAATTPFARTSHRRMPPKILMNTPFTDGSLTRILNAFFTSSADAPPPTSRSFARETP